MAATKDIRLLVKAEVEKAIKDLNRAEKELTDLDKSAASGAGSMDLLAGATKAFIAVLAIKEVAGFALETAKLTDKAVDLRQSLRNLANKEGVDITQLMKDLRKSTRNAVGDIELMQQATQAKFLGIDLKNLPILFEFAARRAKSTGKDVTYLVDSIVSGLGRNSKMVLDNLGKEFLDLDSEIIKISKRTGTWNGKLDDNLRKLHLQEAAVNVAKKAISNSSEPISNTTNLVDNFNTQLERLQIVLGAIGRAGIKPILDIILSFVDKLGIDPDLWLDVLSADGLEKAVIYAKRDLRELEAELKELDKTILNLQAGKLGKDQSFYTDAEIQKDIQNSEKRREIVLRDIAFYKDQINKFNADLNSNNNNNDSGGLLFDPQKLLPNFKDAANSANDSLDMLFETVSENAPGFEEALARGRYELEQYRMLAMEIGGIIEGAFTGLADSLVDGASKGSEAWAGFFDDLKRQITRFLVSQIVRTFLNFFFSSIGIPGAGSFFGATIFGGKSTGTAGVFSGGGAGIAGGGGSLAAGGFGLANLSAPQPLPVGGGGFITKQSYIEKTTPVSGRIIVETIAPEMTRVKQYHIDVEDRIAEPHRNRKQRQRRDGTDGIWK